MPPYRKPIFKTKKYKGKTYHADYFRNRRYKRVQGVSDQYTTHKIVRAIPSDTSGRINFHASALGLPDSTTFGTYATLFEYFKVLSITVRFFPAQVGSESLVGNNPGVPSMFQTYVRGNCISWIDANASDPVPTSVIDYINKASCRMIQPRGYHKRWIVRPTGYPEWAQTGGTTGLLVEDKWKSVIKLYGDGFTAIQAPGTQNYFYAQVTYKVRWRSRHE